MSTSSPATTRDILHDLFVASAVQRQLFEGDPRLAAVNQLVEHTLAAPHASDEQLMTALKALHARTYDFAHFGGCGCALCGAMGRADRLLRSRSRS